MDPKTIEAAQKAVAPLLTKLGELGQQGFGLAIRQNYVYAAQEAFYVVLGLVIFTTWMVNLKKFTAWCVKYTDESEGFVWMLYAVAWIVIAVVCGFMFFPNVTEVMGRLINPAWYAISDIINLLKSATGN